jgi:hypothetical protein
VPVDIWLARADAARRLYRQRPEGAELAATVGPRQVELTPLDNCARAKAAATAHTHESELFV